MVFELQAAIKELVENALDAGASSIGLKESHTIQVCPKLRLDVRIKDHGLDTVEVSDNGSGIAEADWPYIGITLLLQVHMFC